MISDPQRVLRIFSSQDARKSAGRLNLDIVGIGASLSASWSLRVTGGSKIKSLRNAPGTDYRLRLGKFRIVFSVIEQTAYIHTVETRDKVYRDASIEIVLKSFYDTIGTQSPAVPALRKLGYEVNQIDSGSVSHPLTGPDWPTSIGLRLRRKQQEFVDSVLPIDGGSGNARRRLMIGFGPPGSGKTVVGIDLAIEKLLDDHTVDILVPSRNLKKEYLNSLAQIGAQDVRTDEDAPLFRVFRFEEYFAQRAGLDLSFDREGRILGWARTRFEEPRLRSRIDHSIGNVDSIKAKERLPVLTDALLEDTIWWNSFDTWCRRAKDPMVQPIVPYIRLLDDMRPGLLDSLDAENETGLLTRAALAGLPPMISKRTARLVIVDEAQDLAPAEWRSLLYDAFVRNRHLDQRVVLLGDLRQRVNLVPFAWEDIKEHARSTCGLENDHMLAVEVDATSYRMKREVARAAECVFDKDLRPPGKFRRTSRLDTDSLPSGGHVTVAVFDDNSDLFERALANPSTFSSTGSYLFIVHGRGVKKPLADRTDVINYSIKEAKGLEEDKIVVHLPFGHEFKSMLQGKIDYDDATEYFTAISRARDGVLLLIDRASWELLSGVAVAWENVELVEGEQLTLDWLSRALEDYSIGLTTEQIIGARLDQLEAAAKDPCLTEDEISETVCEAVRHLSRSADDDTAMRLVDIGATLAATNTTAYRSLRNRYERDRHNFTQSLSIAYLLLFGELAIATAIARNSGESPTTGWDYESLSCLRDESRLQKTRNLSNPQVHDIEWSDDFVVSAVIEEVIETLNSIPGTKARVRLPDTVFTAFAVQDSGIDGILPAADAVAMSRYAEVIEHFQLKLEEEHRRVMRDVEDHCRRLGKLANARLELMELIAGGGKGT